MKVVGVIGHRFLVDAERVSERIDHAFLRLLQVYSGQEWTLLSCLAEGADRLAVQRARTHGMNRLVVPLPLQVSEYIQDFPDESSRHEFYHLLSLADQVIVLEPADSREDAYYSAGRYVLAHCDVVLVIWDGHPARGRAGTGDLVALARQQAKPMVWVWCENGGSGKFQPSSPNTPAETVVYERFPAALV